MTDREWLIWYRNWLANGSQPPIPASKVIAAIDRHLGGIDMRREQIAAEVYNRVFSQSMQSSVDVVKLGRQLFWKCRHHPIAMENWRTHEEVCEHGCHRSALRWFDNGEHQKPKDTGVGI